MKITAVRLGQIAVPLRVPFKTALRTVDSVRDVVVEIDTDTGEKGLGEAPPTGVITGDTTGAIIGAIQDHIAGKLIGRDVDEFEDVIQEVQKAVVHNTSAKAAVDMALYDLYGQLYHIPVYKLLGGARRTIVTDITISVNPPEQMPSRSRSASIRRWMWSDFSLSAVRSDRMSASALMPIRPGRRSRRSGFWIRWRSRESALNWWNSR